MLVILHKGIPKHVLITEVEAKEIRSEWPVIRKTYGLKQFLVYLMQGKKLKLRMKMESYQNNLEQIQYFNGDVVYLIARAANRRLIGLKTGSQIR